MRCLLIYPPITTHGADSPAGVAAPLGLAYIAAVLEKEGYEVKILDALALGSVEKGDNYVRVGLGLDAIERCVQDYNPAIYDSGGMTACEAMACGLPGVSFDLEALKTYYPKGMIKTPCYDLKAFAENIRRLLEDEELYKKTRHDAMAWSQEWDWGKRAEKLLQAIEGMFDYGD